VPHQELPELDPSRIGTTPHEDSPPPLEPPTEEYEEEVRRRRLPRWLRVALIVLFTGWVMSLMSWTYAGPSKAMCATCHAVEAAATSAPTSIHADVPCLACHKRPGILGAIVYQPTLLRETVHNLTGIGSVEDGWKTVDCSACHAELAVDSPLLAEGHPGPDADCSTCHGDVAHPLDQAAPAGPVGPHPAQYTFLHGRDAVPDAATCAECHADNFCSACHLDNAYPHPDSWIEQHGAQTLETPSRCSVCHADEYCSACHGTTVPHPDDWLKLHRSRLAANPSACGTCHAQADCAVCHARHDVHIQQRLFEWEYRP
jgi:hypothetical protein